jgi:Flp pilus assembly CpaF family ATPase
VRLHRDHRERQQAEESRHLKPSPRHPPRRVEAASAVAARFGKPGDEHQRQSTAISIRKFSEKPIAVGMMRGWGSLSEKMATVLKIAGAARMNVIISGGTGSGKTTMLNAFDLLAAMNTGHDGSMATLHSNSPRECLARMDEGAAEAAAVSAR